MGDPTAKMIARLMIAGALVIGMACLWVFELV